MQEFKSVRSSQFGYPNEVDEKSSPTTVYVRENIKRIDEDEFAGWEYDEKQYTRDEYSELKISILTQENEKLKIGLATVEATHSDLIFDIDFRVMDLEDAVGVNPVGINLFNLKGGDNMNSTFVMLLSKIENGYYDTREEIEAMADRYLARKRISVDEYDILMSALDKKEAEKNPVPEV